MIDSWDFMFTLYNFQSKIGSVLLCDRSLSSEGKSILGLHVHVIWEQGSKSVKNMVNPSKKKKKMMFYGRNPGQPTVTVDKV